MLTSNYKYFLNTDTETFNDVYDGIEYEIKSGEKLLFPDFMCDFFAKHLTDRILTNENQLLNTEYRKQVINKMSSDIIATKESDQRTTGERLRDTIDYERMVIEKKLKSATMDELKQEFLNK